jgi:hypothetical protein
MEWSAADSPNLLQNVSLQETTEEDYSLHGYEAGTKSLEDRIITKSITL